MSCTWTKGNQAAVRERPATYLVDILASHVPSHPASGVPRANSRWVGPRAMQGKTDQGTETDARTAGIPSGVDHLSYPTYAEV